MLSAASLISGSLWLDMPPAASSGPCVPVAGMVGPDRQADGVVRWRRIDLKLVIKKRFGVDFHERYVGTLLKKLGFSHVSARPRHPGQDAEIIEAFRKPPANAECSFF